MNTTVILTSEKDEDPVFLSGRFADEVQSYDAQCDQCDTESDREPSRVFHLNNSIPAITNMNKNYIIVKNVFSTPLV